MRFEKKRINMNTHSTQFGWYTKTETPRINKSKTKTLVYIFFSFGRGKRGEDFFFIFFLVFRLVDGTYHFGKKFEA